ncbi:hypothetical protein GDO78_013768 [Eleutherodactylus coqui]|uniref:Uncharacterized protein n=1 Tax=Eleutherodactylus coqui TaxID=57060 RepID=A0A8J6JQX8_ELECQ|nr:hypothetical protein GDO78_013768 [Eleutherodactylus coqui]
MCSSHGGFQQDNSQLHKQGGNRKPPQYCHPSVAWPVTRFITNRTCMGPSGTPTSTVYELHDLKAQLQQMWSNVLKDIRWSLYACTSTHITSCIQAIGGTTGY